MKFKTVFLALALALLWVPNVLALETPALAVESATNDAVTAEAGVVELTVADLAAMETAVDQLNVNAACADTVQQPSVLIGTSALSCDASCRAQGYDYGVQFGSYCVCRFYY